MAAETLSAKAIATLADASAEALLYGEVEARDERLSRLADLLDRFEVSRRKQSRLAHYAYRTPSAVPLWLRSTAALCRLVQSGDEDPNELISRLVALSWGLGGMDARCAALLRDEDADLIRRYESLTFGVMKAIRGLDGSPSETREGRRLTAWLAKLAGASSSSQAP
jgi:hypothetical protein